MDETSKRILSLFDELQRESLDLHTFLELSGGNHPAEREAVLDAVMLLASQGLLKTGTGADFYSRTEDGRLALAGPRDITLYTRPGCHLCDEAKNAIAPLAREYGVAIREVNIDEDPALFERYANDVPVILLGTRKAAKHRVDPVQFRHQLEHAVS